MLAGALRHSSPRWLAARRRRAGHHHRHRGQLLAAAPRSCAGAFGRPCVGRGRAAGYRPGDVQHSGPGEARRLRRRHQLRNAHRGLCGSSRPLQRGHADRGPARRGLRQQPALVLAWLRPHGPQRGEHAGLGSAGRLGPRPVDEPGGDKRVGTARRAECQDSPARARGAAPRPALEAIGAARRRRRDPGGRQGALARRSPAHAALRGGRRAQTTNAPAPLLVLAQPAQAVATAARAVCAATNEGDLYCWGAGPVSGAGPAGSVLTPRRVPLQ